MRVSKMQGKTKQASLEERTGVLNNTLQNRRRDHERRERRKEQG